MQHVAERNEHGLPDQPRNKRTWEGTADNSHTTLTSIAALEDQNTNDLVSTKASRVRDASPSDSKLGLSAIVHGVDDWLCPRCTVAEVTQLKQWCADTYWPQLQALLAANTPAAAAMTVVNAWKEEHMKPR